MSIMIEGLPPSLLLALERAINNNSNKTTSSQNIEGGGSINQNILKQLYENELETNIMDKDTLLKTLVEHGVEIISDENDSITCTLNNMDMKFSRADETKPYNLHIECPSEESFNKFMDEVDEEYKANVQEVSYNKIKENIEAKNYTIEQEEIMDDDTIVLTVNLE